MEVDMECLICDLPASDIDVGDDYQERACAKCGHYRITHTALVWMETHGWRFDVKLTRAWLAHQQGSGLIPIIDSQQASVLIQV
jgi:hypothetical protein